MARRKSDYWALSWRPSKNKREELENNKKTSLLNIETLLYLSQLISSLYEESRQIIINKSHKRCKTKGRNMNCWAVQDKVDESDR